MIKMLEELSELRHKKKIINFIEVTGTVLGSEKYSETHVSSSGGGGWVGTNGGYVEAPTVNSTSVTNHNFWIRTDDGKEKAVRISGCDIPLRSGQRVSVVYASRRKKKGSYPALLVNHSADDFWIIRSGSKFNLIFNLEVFKGLSLLWVLPMLVLAIVVASDSQFSGDLAEAKAILACTVTAFVIKCIIKYGRYVDVRDRLNRRLKDIGSSLLSRK